MYCQNQQCMQWTVSVREEKKVNWKYSNWKGNELSTILTWSFHEFTTQCRVWSSSLQFIFWQQTNQLDFFSWVTSLALFFFDCFVCNSINSCTINVKFLLLLFFLSYHCFNFSQFFSSSSLQFDIQFNKFKFFWCCILSKFIWMR